MTLAFRIATPADVRFCCDAWSRSFCNSWTHRLMTKRAQSHGLVPGDWMPGVLEAAKRYVERETTTTIIAYEDARWASDWDIYGFIAADTSEPPPTVGYIYVKADYRKRGFARALFAAAGIDPDGTFRYLAQTRSSEEIAAAGKIPKARLEPTPSRASKEKRA